MDNLMMVRRFIVLWGLASIGTDYAYADYNEKWASEVFLKRLEETRESRLNKIHASLFAEEINISHLNKEIKGLIEIYKDHLQKLETTKKISNVENTLFQDINLLVGHLEKGSESIIHDQGQAGYCFDLISAIESMFEKIENPESSFVELELPPEKTATITSYKRLKGEQLPYYLTGAAAKKKKQEEANDLPPLSLAQIKLSSLIPESAEENESKLTPSR